jgi:penicillin-binding protein 1A
VIDAVLAIEDADFYEHDGVNLRATVRALVENVNAGGIAQGGSTISQQLVKLSLLGSEQNLDRKTTEAFYALRLERQMTKDEILERYLNTIYFGGGAYGVQAAAEVYWGYESASELGWAEAALLAGIIRSPYQFDPTLNPDAARERRSVVLDRLVSTGHITLDEANDYELAPLPDERQEPFAQAPTDYFIQEALDQLLTKDPSLLGGDQSFRFNALYRGGLQIYTTLDPKAQDAAVATRAERLPNIKENCYDRQRQGGDPEGECIPEFTIAVATVDSHTGAVRALLGGPDFQREKFNLATQGGRQVGSSMKTYVLAALFEAGYTPSDTVRTDRPCKFPNPGGTPDPYVVDSSRRSGGASLGSITSATLASNNCSFVRLGQVVGLDKVIEVATRLGVDTSLMGNQLSLPLGPYDIVPMEMASAYAAFANDGVHNEPWYIERIEDRDGNVIYEHRPEGTRAVSTQTARLIAEVLEGNVQRGTGRRAQIDDHFAAGKTGTTQDHYDAWFVGFTDYYTTAVWLGDPNEQVRIEFPDYGSRGWSGSGRGGFGGELPAEVWGVYMGMIHETLEPAPFAEPEPYGGGSYLRAPGEIDFCDFSNFDFDDATRGTEEIDSDGDGRSDCFRPVTTTEPGNGGGGGDGGGGRGGGGGDDQPRPTLPQPTFTLPTFRQDD